MSFWSFIAVLAILSLMFGALYVSKLATNKEEEQKEKRKKIRELRSNLVDIDEILNTLTVYDRNTDLLTTLVRRMEMLIKEGLQLIPDSAELKTDLADLDKINAIIQELKDQPKEPETPVSDRQIFLMKKHFARTIRLIKELHSQGHVDELHSGDHRARLMKNSLLLEVKAYQIQGDQAKNKGEISSAANFYKHAKELLVNSEIKFPDKINYIQQTSKKISGLYITVSDDSDEGENSTKNKHEK